VAFVRQCEGDPRCALDSFAANNRRLPLRKRRCHRRRRVSDISDRPSRFDAPDRLAVSADLTEDIHCSVVALNRATVLRDATAADDEKHDDE